MLYSFKGVDQSGKTKSGSVDAASPRDARTRLRTDGVFVTGLTEEKSASKIKSPLSIFKRSVPSKEVTSCMRQMASLLAAGIPLMETIDAIQKQSASPLFKKILNEIKDDVRQGEPLADALARSPEVFDALSVATVRAGEEGGNLAQVLNQIADYKETSLRREGIMKSAMVYPLVVALVGIGVVLFLLVYVVPKVVVIFEDLEQALPLSTKILIGITNVLANYGFWIGVLLCVVLLLINKFLQTDRGKRLFDSLSIRLWIIGPVVKTAVLSRWSHTAATLLGAGVPLLRTLKLSAEVAQNTLYSEALEDASTLIREGGEIAVSLEKSGLFPPVALQMIAAGEKSGQSAKLLMQVANDQGAELENRLTALLSLVQPALIVIMGLTVGFIVMAILLPIFEISQLLG